MPPALLRGLAQRYTTARWAEAKGQDVAIDRRVVLRGARLIESFLEGVGRGSRVVGSVDFGVDQVRNWPAARGQTHGGCPRAIMRPALLRGLAQRYTTARWAEARGQDVAIDRRLVLRGAPLMESFLEGVGRGSRVVGWVHFGVDQLRNPLAPRGETHGPSRRAIMRPALLRGLAERYTTARWAEAKGQDVAIDGRLVLRGAGLIESFVEGVGGARVVGWVHFGVDQVRNWPRPAARRMAVAPEQSCGPHRSRDSLSAILLQDGLKRKGKTWQSTVASCCGALASSSPSWKAWGAGPGS